MGRRKARRFNQYFAEITFKRFLRSIQIIAYKYTR